MKTNARTAIPRARTHGGAPAMERQSPDLELLRSVGSCLLFEDSFYESGRDAAMRIAKVAQKASPTLLADLAVYARQQLNLRHVSLWLAVQALRRPDVANKAQVVDGVIRRADELAEILALYWLQNGGDVKAGRHKRAPLSAALLRGLRLAWPRFNAYGLAKYDRANAVRLRDSLRLAHPKPENAERSALWRGLLDGTLPSPDTWEVALSAGKDKKETFERLIHEGKLGALALLRNLRNMRDAKVKDQSIRNALTAASPGRILPYQFIAAARAAPAYEDALEEMMLRALADAPKLKGRTLLIVDTSGSMNEALGGKTEMSRIDAAGGLTIQVREVCESAKLYATAGDDRMQRHATMQLPSRRGFALVDALHTAPCEIGGGGIFLVQCLRWIAEREPEPFDRVLVFTDEQDTDRKLNASQAPRLGRHNYIINVASYGPAMPLGKAGWTRINGFSERIVDYAQWIEATEDGGQPQFGSAASGTNASGENETAAG